MRTEVVNQIDMNNLSNPSWLGYSFEVYDLIWSQANTILTKDSVHAFKTKALYEATDTIISKHLTRHSVMYAHLNDKFRKSKYKWKDINLEGEFYFETERLLQEKTRFPKSIRLYIKRLDGLQLSKREITYLCFILNVKNPLEKTLEDYITDPVMLTRMAMLLRYDELNTSNLSASKHAPTDYCSDHELDEYSRDS